MASISSLGAGSGIFSSDLVDKLVQAEKIPTETRLNSKEQSVKAQVSAFGAIRNALETLQSSFEKLSTEEGFQAYTASSSNEDVMGISVAEANVAEGTYSIQVNQLAQRQSLASGDYADRSATAVGTGTLSFTVNGQSTQVVIDGANNTLDGIAAAINDAGAGLSAGVVNTGTGYRLVMTADESGLDNVIQVSVSGDGDGSDSDSGGLSSLAYDGAVTNLTETVAAKNAELQVNGIAITRSSNVVDEVIDGVTIDLKSTGESTIKISQDSDAVAARVQGFVDKYNSLQDVIKSTSGFDSDSGRGGVLSGDSTVRGLRSDLRNILTVIPQELNSSPVRMLADIGITTDPESGRLKFDQDLFKDKLQSNPGAVSTLFTAEDGIASLAETSLKTYLQFEGRLDNRTNGLNKSLGDIQDQRERLDLRIQSYRERLVNQFSAADSLIAQLQSTGDFVSRQLAAIAPQQRSND